MQSGTRTATHSFKALAARRRSLYLVGGGITDLVAGPAALAILINSFDQAKYRLLAPPSLRHLRNPVAAQTISRDLLVRQIEEHAQAVDADPDPFSGVVVVIEKVVRNQPSEPKSTVADEGGRPGGGRSAIEASGLHGASQRVRDAHL